MLVTALNVGARIQGSSGWFSNSKGLSASMYFLSFPPPPSSFQAAPSFAQPLAQVPCSLFRDRTATFATTLRRKTSGETGEDKGEQGKTWENIAKQGKT